MNQEVLPPDTNSKDILPIICGILSVIGFLGVGIWHFFKSSDTPNTNTKSDSTSTSTSTDHTSSFIGSVEEDNSVVSELDEEEERINAVVDSIILPALDRADGSLSQCLKDNLLLEGNFEAQLNWLACFFHKFSPNDLGEFRMFIIQRWLDYITTRTSFADSPAAGVYEALKEAVKAKYGVDL